jgi:methylmalonyl-CoA mutase
MNDEIQVYRPQNNVRVVTATSLFDGHDASINIFRRILQSTGVEVIHLGHNRSVKEIVDAAIQEDAQGIAISSYQGGHLEFFKYMVDLLKDGSAEHIKVFGGGGGVIVPEEIKELEAYGVTKIYSPEDGTQHGASGDHQPHGPDDGLLPGRRGRPGSVRPGGGQQAAGGQPDHHPGTGQSPGKRSPGKFRRKLKEKIAERKVPVIGITGTGGAGKSSLTDELILRMLHDLKDIRIAIISADPSRRKTGGALLGDRIRMNAIDSPRVYMRSIATRRSHTEIPEPWAKCWMWSRRPATTWSSPKRPASARGIRTSSTWWTCPCTS